MPLIGRLFLLLLLACDFVGDPGLAVSPLARPHCSTPTHDHSLLLRGALERNIVRSAESPNADIRAPRMLRASFENGTIDDASARNPASCCLTFFGSFLPGTSLHCLLQRFQR